jgi:hypothetical protein
MTALDEAGARAVAEHFAGDLRLYQGFAAICARQFAADARQGQEACAAGQLQALRHVAHNLRFALELLVQPHLLTLAAAVEREADAGATEAAVAAWRELQPALSALAQHLAPAPQA